MNKEPFFIYLIECSGLYKIGKAMDPEARLRQLRTCAPFPMNLVHTFECSDMAGERRLHAQFVKKRRVGEWFALAPEDGSFIREIESFSDDRFWTWEDVIGPFAHREAAG